MDDFGAGDSELVCSAVAKRLNIDRNSIFPSSTGIIGWKLPVDEIVSNGLGGAVSTLQGDSMYPAALGITTTDRYPKVQYYQSKDRRWSISGIAKGAGMIGKIYFNPIWVYTYRSIKYDLEPNMATMLSYILTDLSLPREYLQNCLSEIVAQSFNVITVGMLPSTIIHKYLCTNISSLLLSDGDQSTSDTVLLLSSKKVDAISNDDLEFKIALLKICCELAEDIVRNGEGTNHVIKLTVSGAPSAQIARDLGRFVLNSNLLKCAIAGNDPNVGRIVAAIGSYFGKNGLEYLQKGLSIRLGDVEIFSNDQFQLNPTKEAELSDYMLACQLFEGNIPEIERTYPPHFKTVDVCIILDTDSKDQLTLFGSDLTAEYVAINADYRS